MTLGSLPPLSPRTRALLSAEREIVPRPEAVRRRAVLRARMALWHARDLAQSPGTGSALVTWWRRVSLAAVALLIAGSAYAAWIALAPASTPDAGANLVASPPAQHPSVRRVPLATAPSDDSGTRLPTNPEQMPPAAQSETDASASARAPAHGTQRRVRASDKNERDPTLEELALLDRARRAVLVGDFRAALQGIERHARSFPKSQLGEEREALRVRALAGAGLSRTASQAARDFESSYPKSVLKPELQKSDRTRP